MKMIQKLPLAKTWEINSENRTIIVLSESPERRKDSGDDIVIPNTEGLYLP